jgi:hypothetical protein
MRLVTTVTIALLALLATAGSAVATHSNGKGPGKDLVAGTGAVDTPVTPFGPIFVKLHVNAKSGPDGENPRGRLVFRGNPPPFGAVDIRAKITCVNVSGNQATVGFVVTKSRAGFPVGTNGEFSILDAGEPGAGGDRFEGRPVAGGGPSTCEPFFPRQVITQGNFIVHDATP